MEPTPTTSTERTPLTSQVPPKPAYIFPGVSPRSRRRQMKQFQCCLCTVFLAIFIMALIIGISYTMNERKELNLSLAVTDPLMPVILDPDPLNSTQITELLSNMEYILQDEPIPAWAIPQVLKEDIVEADTFGIRALGDKEILEENMVLLPINSPSYRHSRAICRTSEARKLARRGYVECQSTTYIARKYNYTKPKEHRGDIGLGPKTRLRDPTMYLKCDFNSPYRTANGTCNNKYHPRRYGVAFTSYRRALRPDYADGISAPRKSISGKDLPSAREISLQIHRQSYATDPNFTVMLAVWGQFMDHDVTATALTEGQDGESINCCALTKLIHPECFPVPLSLGDPFFDDYNITCMNFMRSAPAPNGRYGSRNQLNQATAFIDASVVYGNSDNKQLSLRTNHGGLLRMFITPNNRSLLPISTDLNDGCNRLEMYEQGKYCFESGDNRANENLHLTTMHLIFARHHNFLASNLQNINPNWDDEKCFQEARKILGAQMQHITYNELLPILFGKDIAEKKNFIPNKKHGRKDTYNPAVNPSIANNFASSAFRFAHSLLPALFRMSNNNTNIEAIQLHKMLFNPFSLWRKDGVNNAIHSASNTLLMKYDQFFTTELTEKLFENDFNITNDDFPTEDPPEHPPGLDLVTLNIQRGRDHGLPSYPEWRKHCGLPSVDTWKQMANAIDSDSLENMKRIYENPHDVDMYTGALSEPPVEGAILGPLLTCLISDQFQRIKMGDSFWYERRVGPQRFTKEQLNEIYKTTLAGVICQNADALEYSQRYVMMRIDNKTNPLVSCDELKEFDFTPWSKDREKLEQDRKVVKINSGFSSVHTIKNVHSSNTTIKL